MHFNTLAFAVPLFLFFMGWEYWYTQKKGLAYFHYGESIANLNIGITERLLDVFTTALFFYFFDYLHRHFALFNIHPTIAGWIALFVFTDFLWYWYHRFGHEINLFWAAHVVHHQSEDYNFTVSARITLLQSIARSLFWSILPLIGFPAEMITVFLLIHGTYPFFVHTRVVGKLGWIEYFFVTPSHHRVHHSSNPAYLDKNYGDILIIWDKIFGTFVEENEEPKYGLTKSLNSYSYLWQHFHFPLELAYACKKTKGITNILKVIFGKPDDLNPNHREKLETIFLSKKRLKSIDYPVSLKQYVTIQTGISIVVLFLTALLVKYLSIAQLWILSLFIIVSLINTGAILEQRRWVFYLECARLVIICVGAGIHYPNIYTIAAILTIFGILLYYYRPAQKYYYHFLFEKQLQ
jgi:sterol desaturase/sphingolipid hydroxylase (fatty acid hydroxylase superfamily)